MGKTIVPQIYYLYRHIRLDKNEPFYIGIGTTQKEYTTSWERFYRRAYTNNSRNNLWKNIKNKTEYEVEILFESSDEFFIKSKEEEFIKLYGRKDLGTGTLANMTDGGELNIGIIPTKERRKKMSERMKGDKNHFYGKTHTIESIRKMSKKNKGVIITEETKKKISDKLKGRKLTKEEAEKRYKKGNLVSKLCIHIETNQYFNSIREGCISLGLNIKTEQYRVREGRGNFKIISEKLEKVCYDKITKKSFKSIAEASRELGINYNEARKKIDKEDYRLKRITK